MKSAIILGLFCALVGAGTVSAQITVSKNFATKDSIDLSGIKAGGGSGAQFLRTLQDDLVRSGWFNLGRPGGSTYAVSGTCDPEGGALKASVLVLNTGLQKQLLSQAYSQPQGDGRRLGHRVADAIVEAIKGIKGFSGCRLVMIGTVGGNKELFLCDADGGNVTQLTTDKSISLAPSWGPHGDQILYTSFVRGFADIYLINLSTGKRTCVANYSGMNMAGQISPDGQEIVMVCSKDGNPDLYVKNLGSSKVSRLTTTKSAGEACPAWSPDGGRIVYASDAGGVGSPQLYIIGRTSAAARLTTRGSENVTPDWGRNGKIAYTSKRDGHYAIVVYDPANQSHQPVAADSADWEDPSWAPDGRHIFCSRTAGYHSDIYLLDTLGDPPVRLTQNGGNWRSPACSP